MFINIQFGATSTSYLQKEKVREGLRLCEDLHVAKSQENDTYRIK